MRVQRARVQRAHAPLPLTPSFLSLGALLLLLSISGAAHARLNPLHVIDEQRVRPEVMIVLDSSGSMRWYPNYDWGVGNDCGGNRVGTVDLCGDGLCSGGETTSNCSSDCNIWSNNTATAGSPPMCNKDAIYYSRIFILKRVLRNLLPPLRKSASFGLTTFDQTGYFLYYQGTTGTTRKVSVFFSKTEMQNLGAWDSTNSQPNTTFTWNGTTYTLLSSAGSPLTVTKDSLYSRYDNVATENRFAFSTAGTNYNDGSYLWNYAGSYYTYTAVPLYQNSGSYTTQTLSTYKGPQYVDSSSVTWVYSRYDYNDSDQGFTYTANGLVRVPLSGDTSQAAIDSKLYSVLSLLSSARNGGVFAASMTPTGPAIAAVQQHYLDRQAGTGTFASVGADPAAACRKRFVLVLTDGQSNQGTAPETAAQTLYNDTHFSSNPIQTVVVGIPGLPSSAVAELDRIADMGDDGLANNSTHALIAADETDLITLIKTALLNMTKGDYTTSASSATTSSSSTVTGNLVLLPSTEYPGWKGQLKAYDLTSSSTSATWDAASLLNSMTYTNRKLYTGFPSSSSGNPVALLASDGSVNLSAVKSVWSAAISPTSLPSDAIVRSTVEYVVGKSRTWRLDPIIRSVPAVVGPPPKYDAADHSVYENTYVARDKLAYVASTDGVLHAFRIKDGSEAFGYVPPNLWPKIQLLAQLGGQDPDPALFTWILASSPRVEDIPSSCTGSGSCTWSTQLILTMGPGDKSFVVLDVTNPSTCYAGTCTLNTNPFKILYHSKQTSALSSYFGETWSVPAVYYDYGTGGSADKKPLPRVSMGSGYGTSSQGSYYNYFSSLWNGSASSALHSGSGAVVDYAVFPDTAAAIDPEGKMKVIAAYQGDLVGKIKRYPSGDASATSTTILDGATSNPFYYSPAVLTRSSTKVSFAAVSWSQDEDTAPSAQQSTMYLRTETSGAVDSTNDLITCPVSSICSGGTCGTPPTTCSAPSSTAMPVAAPLLVQNDLTTGKEIEAFFLYYQPATTVCGSGSSYLIRVASAGTTQTVVTAKQYSGMRASGLTIVGGGTDVVITASGLKGSKASVTTLSGSTLSGSSTTSAPYVESWREVK
jgi:hypothetical protein